MTDDDRLDRIEALMAEVVERLDTLVGLLALMD